MYQPFAFLTATNLRGINSINPHISPESNFDHVRWIISSAQAL
jgi:hypothetical protein